MAKKTELYSASIVENEVLKEIQVDIFDLPYDKFNDAAPLIINGDVSLGRLKGRELPNMRNVVIMGALDLGEFKITPDTILPDQVSEIICEHSVNSLDDLPKNLPSKLKQIRIRHALFNNIKKDKDGALAAARRFVAQHKRIRVTDGSAYLRDLLKDIEREIAQKQSVQPEKSAPIKPAVVLGDKTEEYYSTDELVTVCRGTVPEFANLTDAELARYIKQARSSRANLKIEPVELKRADGVKIVCVHSDYVDTIIGFILAQIDANKERTTKKTKEHKLKTKLIAPVQRPVVEAERLYQLDGRKFHTAEIKKYIPKREWNEIKSDRNGNKKELLEILREINVINVNPTDTDGSKVYYIEDGQIKASRVLELKNSRCLAQGFGNLNSRQRIVWGISGNVFVCVDFFVEHEHALHKYKNVIRNMDLDLSRINLAEYYSVSDLIDELSDGRDGPSGPDGSCAPTDPKVPVGSAVSGAPSTMVDDSVSQNEKVVVSDKKAKVTSVDAVVSAADKVNENKISVGATAGINPTGIVWAELYSLNMRLTQQISLVDGERKIILNKMQTETNTDKLLRMTRDIAHNLQRKKELEEMMAKLHEMNKKLIGWQSNLDKQK